jgi:polyisoprenoid-binding protein YceI
MKPFTFSSLVTLTAMLFIAGCSDPADKVHKSAASEPTKPEAAPTPSVVGGKEYVIRNADSKIGFVGSKITRSHDGGFTNFAGNINVADGRIAGTPEIKINLKSIWTDNEKLTGHLKSSDFFDVEKYPVSTFTITSIDTPRMFKPGSTELTEERHVVVGNLDLHGVTKSISFPAKIEIKDEAVMLHAEFAINRKDFNINYPGKSDDLIRDDVVLKLAMKATPGEAKPEDQIAK